MFLIVACPAGRFGFQREMNALETLKTGQDTEDAANVAALLQSTHEIELRTQQVNRWFRLWRRDVRDGWLTLGRFRVSPRGRLLAGELAGTQPPHCRMQS